MLTNLSLQRTPNLLVQGKGRKERCLPLWKETAADLRAWLAVRGHVRAPELFVNADGRAMTRAGFEYVLDKHARAAAAACPSLRGRSVSPHQLRHSCAVIMLQATRDVRRSRYGSAMPISARQRCTCAWTPHESWRPSSGYPAGAASRAVQGARRADRLFAGRRLPACRVTKLAALHALISLSAGGVRFGHWLAARAFCAIKRDAERAFVVRGGACRRVVSSSWGRRLNQGPP